MAYVYRDTTNIGLECLIISFLIMIILSIITHDIREGICFSIAFSTGNVVAYLKLDSYYTKELNKLYKRYGRNYEDWSD